MKDSTRKWLFSLILGLMIWSFLFFTRIYWYKPWCAVDPSPCQIDTVNSLDRIVFQFSNVQADFWSNVSQNFIGIFVFAAPWFLFSRRSALAENLYIACISFWNLAWLEIVRAAVQRPRPLVFNGVMSEGANIHQYTSFYSGHTSFVTLASLSFFFMMKRRYPGLGRTTLGLLLMISLSISVLTGTLRVLGGRHYPTDVIFALIMGIILTLHFQKRIDALR